MGLESARVLCSHDEAWIVMKSAKVNGVKCVERVHTDGGERGEVGGGGESPIAATTACSRSPSQQPSPTIIREASLASCSLYAQ